MFFRNFKRFKHWNIRIAVMLKCTYLFIMEDFWKISEVGVDVLEEITANEKVLKNNKEVERGW